MDTDFASDAVHPSETRASFRFEPTKTLPMHARRISRFSRYEISAWALSGTRRATDFMVAVAALVLFLPIMGVVAIIVRLGSPGPVLFRQKRMGRNGLAFTLYKFRSMHVENDPSSPITVTGDSRITPVGKFLRKYKLDELPQFWNVLRGDMSLVGPRPKLPHHEALHMPFRPGITGPATLAFRYEEEMLRQVPREHLDAYYERFVKPQKAQIDWNYMKSATPKSDLGILWRTARSCCSGGETGYRANLPDFSDTVHEFLLRPTGTDHDQSFSVSTV